MITDPVPLAQALIRRASVTPADEGAQAILAETLDRMGFTVTTLRFGQTPNLFARLGTEGPHLCFAGHTDVVPPGEGWHTGPFAGDIRDGVLYGRGACDMKGAIAAFVAGVARYLERGSAPGSVSLLITGDEEGPATDGTVRVLDWMRANGHVPDFCLVGEPTNPTRLGEAIKIGRRGSLNAVITVMGQQGHAAYPARADNPVHRLIAALHELIGTRLDDGTKWFEPTGLQVTGIDVGNPAVNVIPAEARAQLNIRFNDRHHGAALDAWLHQIIGRHASRFAVSSTISGEAFLTTPGPAVQTLQTVIRTITGLEPRLETGGGTSDARFIAPVCPVAEFGLVGASMHQIDEAAPVEDIRTLARIYMDFLKAFCG